MPASSRASNRPIAGFLTQTELAPHCIGELLHARPSLTPEIDRALDVAVSPYFSSLNLLSKSEGLPAERRIITHANSRAIVKKQLKWRTVSEHTQTRACTLYWK